MTNSQADMLKLTLKILGDPDYIKQDDILNDPKCILYKCIQKNVNFDINNHNFLTLGLTNVGEITQLYYNTYKEIDFK